MEKQKVLVTKAESKAEQDKIKKIKTYHSSFINGHSYFGNDGTQNYLYFNHFLNIFRCLKLKI